MAMYTKHVYPQIPVDDPHVRPAIPGTFVKVHEISVTWDIRSANVDDRAEYWEDTVGTLTDAEVETVVYGGAGKAQWIIDNPPPE